MPKKITTSEFIERSKNIHKEKYDYSLAEYKDLVTDTKIICPIHGIFLQKPGHHLSGCGCVKCGLNKKADNRKKSIERFINESNEIHRDSYDYTNSIYLGAHLAIEVGCNIHGSFWTTPDRHISGQCGCPLCSTNIKILSQEFINRAINKHSDRYDYSNINYIGYGDKISIGCKKHGIFYQRPRDHAAGQGCPKCTSCSVSKSEQEWLNYLSIPDTIKNRQVWIKTNRKRVKVDGYVPETNTIYEFWGDFWHGNPKIYKPDDINVRNKKSFGELFLETEKRKILLKDAGYNLIEIWESDWTNLKRKL